MGGGVSIQLMREDSTLPDQPNGWLIDSTDFARSITFRQAYERYVLGATKPPEAQFQRHYDATKEVFIREGYSEKETKWWFLRTGQGPKCYRQYSVGGECGLPPYEVWFKHYFKRTPDSSGVGCFYVWADRRNNDCYMMQAWPIYPPPGYRMPGIPCNATGKSVDVSQKPYTGSTVEENQFWAWLGGAGPWPFPDLPAMWGDSNSASFSFGYFGAFDATGIIGAGFCSDVEAEETAGLLHPVPLAYTVFYPSSVRVSFGPVPAIRGLPIGAMAMLDRETGKQWPDYFETRVRSYLASTDWRTQYQAWPFALRDTLAQFGVKNTTLLSLSSKLLEAARKGLESYKRKKGPTLLMAGGSVAQIFTAAVVSFITFGVATAAMGLITEAIVSTGIAEAATVAETVETIKEVQTVYNVVKEVQSDNPNLLSIGSGLLSMAGALIDAGVDVGVDGVAYDYSMDGFEPVAVGGEQVAFDYTGDNLMPLDLGEASDLTGGILTDALNEIDIDYDYSGFDFAGVAAADMRSSVENIVSHLDEFAGDPNALYAAIEAEAVAVTNDLTDVATAAVDEVVAADIDTAVGEVLADNAECAAQCDMGELTVDELDMTELAEGWTTEEVTGLDYEQMVETETPELEQAVVAAEADISIEQIEAVLKVADQIASVVEPLVIAPPPPPPPPPTPAQIVAAPAPEQPLPGPVATVQPTVLPDSITALVPDYYPEIPLTAASFGPVAPDGEKGFNLWWLLPLGLLAIPLGDKKRRPRRKGRK